jgi:hypothetical protein
MGRDHTGRPSDPGNTTGTPRDSFDLQVKIELDEPDEYRYNAVPNPLRRLAERTMRKQDYAPVPDYDVLLTGTDAEYVVNNLLDQLEIEAKLNETGDRRVERVPVNPADFSHDRGIYTIQNPVPLEPLVSGDGPYGEPWPADDYQIIARLIQPDGRYIY